MCWKHGCLLASGAFPLQEYQPCAHTPAVPSAPQCARHCPCSPAQRGSPGTCSPTMQWETDLQESSSLVNQSQPWEGSGCPSSPTAEAVQCQTKGDPTHISARAFCTSPHGANRQKSWSIHLLFLSQKHIQKWNPKLSKLNFTKKAKYLQWQATVK